MTAADPTRKSRTKDERRQHYRHLEELLDAGKPTLEIVADHMTRHGLSRRQSFRDLRDVRARILRRAIRDLGGRRAAVAMTYRRLEMLFRLSVEKQEFDVGLKVLDAEAKLLGLYPPTGRTTPSGTIRDDLYPPKPIGTGAVPATA